MKRLRTVVISVLPWVIGGGAIGGTIVFVANQQHRAAEKYEAEREKRCTSSFRLDPEKQDACKHERDIPGNYLPWGYVLVAWPEGITAWLLILTLGAIVWQSWETRKAAEAANRGIEISKTKGRAKLLLSPQPLNPKVGIIPEAKLVVTNVGESNALVGEAIAGLHLSDPHTLIGDGSGYYDMKVGYRLLESKEFFEEIVYWPTHGLDRYSQDVIDDKVVVHLHGSIRFRDTFDDGWGVNFHFVWRTYDEPRWFPHLQEHKYGEWKNQDEIGEYSIAKDVKHRWWKFWLIGTPPHQNQPQNPN